MLTFRNPSTVAKPGAAYSHAIEVPPAARWLHISGQVGLAPDGRPGEGFAEQAEFAWKNILAILADAGMAVPDLVKVTSFLTRPGDIATYRTIRDRFQAGHRPASTLLVVAGLANPQWLIEVEATAAKV